MQHTTRSTFRSNLVKLLSLTSTISFIVKLLVDLIHFACICKDGKYSLTKQSQNILDNAWTAFPLIWLSTFLHLILGLKCKGCVPIKKRLHVNSSRSLTSLLKGKRGWLSRINSTLIKNVLNDSLYTGQSWRTDFNDCLVSLTTDSQEPPIHGLDWGLYFHVTPLLRTFQF